MAERVQTNERPKRASAGENTPEPVVKRVGGGGAGPTIIKDMISKLEDGPDTVTVACKLPNGLILRLFGWAEIDEPILGGGVRRTKVAQPLEETITINGNSVPMNGMAPPFTVIDAHMRGDGYGLTYDVPRDFFVEWLKQNQATAIVKEGLVFAYGDLKDVKAAARDHEKVKSGLEPLDPEGDLRAPRQIKQGTRDDKAA